jgi:hypothetical protein
MILLVTGTLLKKKIQTTRLHHLFGLNLLPGKDTRWTHQAQK